MTLTPLPARFAELRIFKVIIFFRFYRKITIKRRLGSEFLMIIHSLIIKLLFNHALMGVLCNAILICIRISTYIFPNNSTHAE